MPEIGQVHALGGPGSPGIAPKPPPAPLGDTMGAAAAISEIHSPARARMKSCSLTYWAVMVLPSNWRLSKTARPRSQRKRVKFDEWQKMKRRRRC